MLDDTEATNWQSLDAVPSVNVLTPEVTVSLAGRRSINRVQVSGMLEVFEEATLENRHTSIHAFRVLACDGSVANCSLPASFTPIFTSPAGAFPSSTLRPLVPDTTIRSFNVPQTWATHVKLEVLHNKCTGSSIYQGYLGVAGQEDNDPINNTSCLVGNAPNIPARGGDVRAAEFQVFGMESFVEE